MNHYRINESTFKGNLLKMCKTPLSSTMLSCRLIDLTHGCFCIGELPILSISCLWAAHDNDKGNVLEPHVKTGDMQSKSWNTLQGSDVINDLTGGCKRTATVAQMKWRNTKSSDTHTRGKYIYSPLFYCRRRQTNVIYGWQSSIFHVCFEHSVAVCVAPIVARLIHQRPIEHWMWLDKSEPRRYCNNFYYGHTIFTIDGFESNLKFW